MNRGDLEREGPCMWRIPQHGKMRVPGRIYASEKMLPGILSDNAADQVINVACLPGIVGASMAMPDIHWGYGFPIGGVAAFDVDEGIVSPGGVGYDINCGVRLMASRLTRQDIEPHLTSLTDALYHRIPTGVGSEGALRISRNDLPHVTEEGARWAVAQGMGNDEELDHIEEGGCIKGADPEQVSPRAWERGKPQIGTLGSGNHFIEIGFVDID